MPQGEHGFRVSWKLCLNLCSRKMTLTKAQFREVFDSFVFVAVKSLFRDCLIYSNKFLLKIPRLAVLRRLGYSLFYSITNDRKSFFGKSYV